jgi:hypothetical protein
MSEILVLAEARQEGPYFDVIVSRFYGLVMLGCLGFLLYLGFTGVFTLFPIFFLFWCPFYKLLCLPIKKKKKKNYSCISNFLEFLDLCFSFAS